MREREGTKILGGCEEGRNNNRLWKGDKLRNKECIREVWRKRRDKLTTACR